MLNVLTERTPRPDSFLEARDVVVNGITGRYACYCVGSCVIDLQKVNSCLVSSYQILRELTDPSPFKVVAAFTTCFVEASPVKTQLPRWIFGGLADKQNAVSAFLVSVDFLHDAELHTKDGIKRLSNRIEISDHYYADLIEALSNCSSRKGIPLISLLYEGLAYQTNEDASYLKSQGKSRYFGYTSPY